VRLLLTALPLRGHVHPMVPLGIACERAGHDVRFAIPDGYVGRVPLPRLDIADGGDVSAVRAHPDADLMVLARAVLGDPAADHRAAALAMSLRKHSVDLVVHDATDVGAAIAAELAGVPSVAFDVGHWRPAAADRAVLEPVPVSLRDLDPPDVPVVPLRPVAWSDGGDRPSRDGRPRVYLTFGTVAAGVDDLAAEVRADLVRLDVDLVDATIRHVDQAAVLADCDVVHHGGTGTMLGAVEHGRPQVVLPQGADQHLNARRLADLGAAVVDPPSVGDAVQRLLRPDAPQRRAVAALRAELLALPAPADVVPALESFAADPRN
jgi:UDP:flavonoid glycosyltransferase YjiC (YdhE family)